MRSTTLSTGAGGPVWSPDGRQIAFTATDPKPQALKDRDKKYGEFEVVDQDLLMTHLYAIDLATRKVRALTKGAFTVGSFSWSPDSRQIAFDHRVNGDPSNGSTADISIVSVADAVVRGLVTQPDSDSTSRCNSH